MEQTTTNNNLPEEITEAERKELIWEDNHAIIAEAIRYLQRKEIHINVSNIARITKLSRKTVYKHFNNDDATLMHGIAKPLSNFMVNEVISRVCRKACFGDLQAAKIYLEIMGVIKRGNNTINANFMNGNKAIMVNGHTFSEEMVQNLSAENLSQLEEFVKSAELSTRNHGLQNIKNITNNTLDSQQVDG